MRFAASVRLNAPEVVKLPSVPIWLAPVSETGPLAAPVRVFAEMTPPVWLIPPETLRVTPLAERFPARVRLWPSVRLNAPGVVKLPSVPIWLAPVSVTGPVADPAKFAAEMTPPVWLIPPETLRVTLLAERFPARVRL